MNEDKLDIKDIEGITWENFFEKFDKRKPPEKCLTLLRRNHAIVATLPFKSKAFYISKVLLKL